MKLGKGKLYNFAMIVLFAILGNIVGEFLGKNFTELKFLSLNYSFGNTQPLTLDLGILNLTMGIKFNFNVLSIVCIIIALIVIKKS